MDWDNPSDLYKTLFSIVPNIFYSLSRKQKIPFNVPMFEQKVDTYFDMS